MPLVTGLQEDRLQVRIRMCSSVGFHSFHVLHVYFLLHPTASMYMTLFSMGSFPSEAEYCGWNENNSSKA